MGGAPGFALAACGNQLVLFLEQEKKKEFFCQLVSPTELSFKFDLLFYLFFTNISSFVTELCRCCRPYSRSIFSSVCEQDGEKYMGQER